uniref:Uncharacterized protein n=1 Tax=Steinernema glaseri TaxID=37863 RepID=A0A1I7Z3B0_9BILA
MSSTTCNISESNIRFTKSKNNHLKQKIVKAQCLVRIGSWDRSLAFGLMAGVHNPQLPADFPSFIFLRLCIFLHSQLFLFLQELFRATSLVRLFLENALYCLTSTDR